MIVSLSSTVSMGAPAAMRPRSGTSHAASPVNVLELDAEAESAVGAAAREQPCRSSASMCLAMVAFEETPKWRAICA